MSTDNDEYQPPITQDSGDTPPDFDLETHIQAALTAEEELYSHIEPELDTYHPSQLGKCDRQAYLSKVGLLDLTKVLCKFKTGQFIHEWLEASFTTLELDDHYQLEESVTKTFDGITLTGTIDFYDPNRDLILDYKSRASWYNFSPESNERHHNQVLLYMGMQDAQFAKIKYVSKKDLEVREFPESGFISYDQDRFDALIEKAKRITRSLKEDGIAQSASEIPFEKCGCYQCESEVLRDSPLLLDIR